MFSEENSPYKPPSIAKPHLSKHVDSRVKYFPESDLSIVPTPPTMHSYFAHEADTNEQNFKKIATIRGQKIFPPFIELTQKSANAESGTIGGKTLIEMGLKHQNRDDWKSMKQPKKRDLATILYKMIMNGKKSDLIITIDGVNFECHMNVMQSYSKVFREFNTEPLIVLPAHQISPSIFSMIYAWMTDEKPLLQPDNILELFKAAMFLRIDSLVNQCWYCFDIEKQFNEKIAFLIYRDSKKHGLTLLGSLMLHRVRKFFLTLVSTKDFLELTAREVCTLLKLNTIGVNTEMEVLMTAVRWLSYKWIERQSFVLDVLKSVRFSLMPTWYLATLNTSRPNDCVEFNRIIENSDVKKLINNGIYVTATQEHCCNNQEQLLHFLEKTKLTQPGKRQWIYDHKCVYHHRIGCKKLIFMSYDLFLDYLDMLSSAGPSHWTTVESAFEKHDTIDCCKKITSLGLKRGDS